MSQGDGEKAKITSESIPFYNELVSKRIEIIDLTAELDRAKRVINELERKNNSLIHDFNDYAQKAISDAEAWQEKIDYLEEQIVVNQIIQRYLRPLFVFVAGFVTATVVSMLMRWYHV